MTTERYYTGRFFTAFLGSALFVAVLCVGIVFFDNNTPGSLVSSITINATTPGNLAPMATIGFAVGVLGGGAVLMLTGWYLIRK